MLDRAQAAPEAQQGPDVDDEGVAALIEDDVAVEDVSIDGMCGVY